MPALVRRHGVPLAVWSMLVAVFFGTFILGTARIENGDFASQFHAFGLFQARQLADGRWPLWSNGSYGGFPFAADTQTALYYPGRWLTLLLAPDFPFHALQLEAIAHFWLAGAGAYAFATRVTRRPIAGLVAATTFGLSGYLTGYPLLQLAILEAMAWLPFVLLAVHAGVTRRRRWLVAAGILLAVAATVGHPQTLLHVGYLAAAYYLFLAVMQRRPWTVIAGDGLLIGALTVGLSLPVWLPALRYLRATTRGAELTYAFVSTGLPLVDYFQAFLPGATSFWTPAYVGLAPLLLCLCAWWGRAGDGRPTIAFWTGSAAVATLLSLGDAGLLFRLAYTLAPGVRLFRQQERWIGVLAFAMAMLAGYGVVAWQQAGRATRGRWLGRGGLILGVGLALSTLSVALAPDLAARAWQPLLLQQLIALAAVVILFGRLQQPRHAAVWLLLPVLIAADLYAGTRHSIVRVPEPAAAYWPQPDWLDRLRADPSVERIDSLGIFWSNFGEIVGMEDVRGISPLKLDALTRLQELPLKRQWELLAVTHVFWPTPPVPDVPLTAIDAVDVNIQPGEDRAALVYRLDDPTARAWLSREPIVVANDQAAFELMADPAFDLRRHVLVPPEAPRLGAMPETAAADAAGSVTIIARAPGRLTLTAETATPAYLFISEWFYPGWQATVNGQPAPLYRVNHGFIGLVLPAGAHTVALTYAPRDVPLAMAGAGATALLAVAAFWYLSRRRRPLGAAP